jgi:hypothetical protein
MAFSLGKENHMKKLIMMGFILSALSYYVACAPVEFARDTNCGSDCVYINNRKEYRYEIIPNEGKVDILIVSDNSASMSFEQNKMADRLSNFIETLDSQNVDYRIAVTTTDIEDANNRARAINQHGALQNGRLIQMSGGKFFISKENTPNQADRVNLFMSAVKRPETLSCESFLLSNPLPSDSAYKQNCPSSDERGFYAASLTISNNYNSFIRGDAHLAVIILSDEDVRSGLYIDYSTYALDQKDSPSYLLGLVHQRYPGKNLRIHSIIVRSGDSACKAAQDAQMNGRVGSSFGLIYQQGSQMTGGVVGNICANDYTSQLVGIATNIGESVFEKTLHCANPQPIDDHTPMVSFIPVANSNSYNIVGNKIQFNPSLLPGTRAFLQYACE